MYRVTCISCGKPYDAERAQECSCLHPVRSFRCPHCAACLCAAGSGALSKFWRDVPPELWQRRMAKTQAAPAPPTEEDVPRPMVLFADDDPVGRQIAMQVIRSLGFGVIVAENGDAALDLARRYQPELIVTDAMMPRLDGRELSRLVKQDLPATRVVIITSVYKDARYKSEAFRNFAVDDYLNKPISPADLRAVVIKHLKAAS